MSTAKAMPALTPKQLQLRRGADKWRQRWQKSKQTPRAMKACRIPRRPADVAEAA